MESRFLKLIDTLARHDVRYIVVGGIAAVLHRVVVATDDFDLVHDRSPENIRRLLGALDELGAVYRYDDRNLRPDESHLAGPGNQLLRSGNLKFDVLGALDPGGDYEKLSAESEVLDVGGFPVRVITLEKLAEIKRLLPRAKDKLMLLHIEAALDERAKAKR